MERFDTLFEKNAAEKGGSFYIRSKIFFAKEHLMQDWPPELNVSQVMKESEGAASASDAASASEQAKAAEGGEEQG